MSSSNDSDPAETITRILFLSPHVHIYAVPPLSSNKGYTTTSWTPLTSPPTAQTPKPEPITTRLRVIESSAPPPPPSRPTPSSSSNFPTSSTSKSSQENQDHDHEEKQPTITTTILLEEKSTGDLFAACPYTSPSAVLPVTDSTRFFALRVEGEGGRMKAVLGVG
ncbi:MAG: hypothetical protein Q9212_002228, partial [Teloschistes hypoglaucus]